MSKTKAGIDMGRTLKVNGFTLTENGTSAAGNTRYGLKSEEMHEIAGRSIRLFVNIGAYDMGSAISSPKPETFDSAVRPSGPKKGAVEAKSLAEMVAEAVAAAMAAATPKTPSKA